MSDSTLTKPPLAIPGFTLERLLGSGATGDVYLASQRIAADSSSLAYRAIKVLNLDRLRQDLIGDRRLAKEHLDAVERILKSVRRRFIAENYLGPALCHPSIVQYFPGGEIDGTSYIVMEYVPGVSLYEYVRGHVFSARPFSRSIRAENALREVARIAQQLADGLEFAHAIGVVHRDIKPDNVRVAVDPAGLRSARAKILDFGIAKIPPVRVTGLPVTQSRTIQGFLGTPDYMPPEQRGKAETADGRSDVFALGQTLLFLLTDHILDWKDFSPDSPDEPAPFADSSPAVVAQAASAIRRWLTEALALVPGEIARTELENAIGAWTNLIIGMVRLDIERRTTMKKVSVELQLLARAVSDEASSVAGRQFAAAVYEWETKRLLPQNENDLGTYLRWAVREELTPSEDHFLRAYEQDVSLRRLRAQEEAQHAMKEAEAAKSRAEASYRRARTSLFTAAFFAMFAAVGAIAALVAWRTAKRAEEDASALSVSLSQANTQLKEQKDLDDRLLAEVQATLSDPNISSSALGKHIKEKFAQAQNDRDSVSAKAVAAQQAADNAKREAEIAGGLAYARKRQLDTCEANRIQCVDVDLPACRTVRDQCVSSDLPNCKTARDQCVGTDLPGCKTARDQCVGTDLPGCKSARDQCVGTDLPGCKSARDQCVDTDLPGCKSARDQCVGTDLPGCKAARDQCVNTDLPACKAAPNQCLSTDLPNCVAARDQCVNTELPACRSRLPPVPSGSN